MKKKILVILGHPDKSGLNGQIVKNYVKVAKKVGHLVKVLYLGDMKFDPILHHGYRRIQKLEPSLVKAQEFIKWANHLVISYPTWWFDQPALLRGFIDRVILPGFAFKYQYDSLLPQKLLINKTARIITTTGGPNWYYKILGNPGVKSLKQSLGFCGIKKVKVFSVGSAEKLKDSEIEIIINKVMKLAKRAA